MHKTIYFIRHGETEGNIREEYSGWNDTPLSPKGIEQIMNKKIQGLYPEVDLHYSSDLSRAIDTHELIYGSSVKLRELKDIREMFFGKYEGKTEHEVENPNFFQGFFEGQRVAGGEIYEEFLKRILNAVRTVLFDLDQENLQSASVVAHSGVIKTLLIYFEKLPLDRFHDIKIKNGMLVEFQFSSDYKYLGTDFDLLFKY